MLCRRQLWMQNCTARENLILLIAIHRISKANVALQLTRRNQRGPAAQYSPLLTAWMVATEGNGCSAFGVSLQVAAACMRSFPLRMLQEQCYEAIYWLPAMQPAA